MENDRLITESRLQRLCAEVLTGRAMASRTRAAELRDEARAVRAAIAQRRRQEDRRARLGTPVLPGRDRVADLTVVAPPAPDRPIIPD